MALFISFFFAPCRGLFPKWLHKSRIHFHRQEENVLKTIYKVGEERGKDNTVVSRKAIEEYIPSPSRYLRHLKKNGFLEETPHGFSLTAPGVSKAREVLRKHRLWELYLMQQMDIAIDHVHRDAEDMEHILSSDVVQELERILNSPNSDPHGKPIPSERI
jgi:manganese/zinc/iron transport system permease protein